MKTLAPTVNITTNSCKTCGRHHNIISVPLLWPQYAGFSSGWRPSSFQAFLFVYPTPGSGSLSPEGGHRTQQAWQSNSRHGVPHLFLSSAKCTQASDRQMKGIRLTHVLSPHSPTFQLHNNGNYWKWNTHTHIMYCKKQRNKVIYVCTSSFLWLDVS